MPADDKYQKAVINALIKDDWQIADEQIALPVDNRNLWVDIEAIKMPHNERIILIEVKGFENVDSPIKYFQQIIGQLVMYRIAMRFWRLDAENLYLAIPDVAYRGFFQETLTQLIISEMQLKLLVFSPEKEEIILWIR